MTRPWTKRKERENAICPENKQTGIYGIRNKINNHIYVGSATVTFHHRWSHHLADLRNNKHGNNKLQNAWNKYGEENFEFYIIEVVTGTKEEILEVEQQYLDVFYGQETCYNLSPNAVSRKGIMSEKTKRNLASFRLISPTGEVTAIDSFESFAETYGLRVATVKALYYGHLTSSNGWTPVQDDAWKSRREHSRVMDRKRAKARSDKLRAEGLLKDVGRPTVIDPNVEVLVYDYMDMGYSCRAISAALKDHLYSVGYVTVSKVMKARK